MQFHLSDSSFSPTYWKLNFESPVKRGADIRKIIVRNDKEDGFMSQLIFLDSEEKDVLRVEGRSEKEGTTSEYIIPERHKLIGAETHLDEGEWIRGISFLTIAS